MKITAATARPVRLRFARPMRTAQGEFREREVVLFELSDEEGVRGRGEAAPWPGFGTETPAGSLAVLQEMACRWTGAELDPGDPDRRDASLLRDCPAARAAVDGALLDLAARRQGRPVRDALAASSLCPAAGAVLARVPVSALLVGQAPDAIEEEAARVRAAGYRAAKLKLGTGSLAHDLERLRAARAGLGPDVALRGDANGAWSLDEALAALEACVELNLDYVEQPVAAGNLDGFARLRGRTPVRIAADESVATEEGALRLIDGALVDVVVLKPAMLGGSSRALDIAARAHRAGIGVVVTHAFETAVGARHALHCAAAWGDAATPHGLVTDGLFERDIAQPVAAEAGYVAIPEQPGLGIGL